MFYETRECTQDIPRADDRWSRLRRRFGLLKYRFWGRRNIMVWDFRNIVSESSVLPRKPGDASRVSPLTATGRLKNIIVWDDWNIISEIAAISRFGAAKVSFLGSLQHRNLDRRNVTTALRSHY